MRRWLTPIALLLAATTAMPLGAQQAPPPYGLVSDSTRAVAEPYLQAYVSKDWDALEALLAEEASFRDPTAELVFGGRLTSGRDAMMTKFRTGYAGVEMSFEPTRTIFSGRYAILEGKLSWSSMMQGGMKVDSPDTPYVLILRVEGGKVVEHRDYTDYHPFIAAYRKAQGG